MKPTEKQQHDFTVLIQAHERLIHKVCGLYIINDKESYKDLYQEIILQAWTAWPRFANEAKASTWLYRIALNTAISYKRNTKKKLDMRPFDELQMQVADIQQQDQQAYQTLWRLIQQLPELEKALILLYLEDNSYEEIASIMGLSVSNVGTRLGRIREKLKHQAQTQEN